MIVCKDGGGVRRIPFQLHFNRDPIGNIDLRASPSAYEPTEVGAPDGAVTRSLVRIPQPVAGR